MGHVLYFDLNGGCLHPHTVNAKKYAGGYHETVSCARNIFISFLSLINILLFTGTRSMTKQVPSKHDTTRTVISILPLATFHLWLIKLVDCSTPCANLTPHLCSYFKKTKQTKPPLQTATKTDIVLKQRCSFLCVPVNERMTELFFNV